MAKKKGPTGNLKFNSKFEHGPFFRGDGFTFLSDEILRREFTHSLNSSELTFLIALNTIAWSKKSLLIQAAVSYLVKVTKLKERTLDRYLAESSRLRRQGFVRLQKVDHADGNQYFIEPVFIWSSKWHLLEGIEQSRLVQLLPEFRQNGGSRDAISTDLSPESRQNGGTVDGEKTSSAKVAEESRQNGASLTASAGTEIRQNGGDPRSDLFSRYDASRQRCPNGQDLRGRGKKGGRLSAAAFEKKRAKLLAQVKLLAQAQKKQKKVGKRATCKTSAQAELPA